jgi:flagellin
MSGQSFSVVNNLSSVTAQRNLYFSNIGLNKTLSRMSSGYRIVDAGDDAAGLAIANGLKADVAALSQAVNNASDGLSIVQIADGTLSQISDLLVRGVTLAEQSASETVGDNERATINIEYQQILKEIDRAVSVANFKGENLFSATAAYTKQIFVGDTHFESYIKVSIAGSHGAGTNSLGLNTANLSTRQGALNSLKAIQTAIASVSKWRGALGAQSNRLTNSVAIIQTQSENLTAAQSQIEDANMAEEVVNMTKWQILLQSGMASLAQANSSSQLVLSLFQ